MQTFILLLLVNNNNNLEKNRCFTAMTQTHKSRLLYRNKSKILDLQLLELRKQEFLAKFRSCDTDLHLTSVFFYSEPNRR